MNKHFILPNDYLDLEMLIDDLRSLLIEIDYDLQKSIYFTAAARRARVNSIKLGKLFRNFRKLSCSAGLK